MRHYGSRLKLQETMTSKTPILENPQKDFESKFVVFGRDGLWSLEWQVSRAVKSHTSHIASSPSPYQGQ